jgi:multidrug transporter EmrE-like cation transporter
LLVFCCTICGAAAQLLIKMGMTKVAGVSGPALFTTVSGLFSLLSNVPLMAGMSLYGISTVLLVLALRGAELSLMYPVISLTYVWVTALSVLVFHESVNPYKLLGVGVIVVGVGVLGSGGGERS